MEHASGEILKKFEGVHVSTIISLAYYKDILLSGSADTSVVHWNVTSGKTIQKYARHDRLLRNVVSWKSLVITAGDDDLISAYETTRKQNEHVFVLHGHILPVNVLFVYEDTLFSGSSDATVRRWNLTTQAIIRVYVGHTNTVNTVIASEGYMYSSGFELVVKAWDITSGVNVFSLAGHTYDIYALAINVNYLLSGSWDLAARKWNIPSRTLDMTWFGKQNYLY